MATRTTTERRQLQRIEAGRRLAALREARGLLQKDLVDRARVFASTVSSAESGSRGLPSDSRVRIAKVLNVDPALLDPASTPDLSIEEVLRRASGQAQVAVPASDPGSRLPPGLEGYFERHPEVAKQKRIRWYLENQTFKAEPWVTFDDKFWGEMYDFWKRYLRELDEEGRAPGPAPAPGRHR